VKVYPSHKLIELDIYDDRTSSELLSQLFQVRNGSKHHKSSTDKAAAFKRTNSNPKIVETPRPGPISLKTKYHEMWDFTTNTITIATKDRFDDLPKTSLEILQQVLHNDNEKQKQQQQSCIMADTSNHDEIRESAAGQIAVPILNMGLPMDPWNDAIRDFFVCVGTSVIHQKRHGRGSVGKKTMEAVRANMEPLTSYFGQQDVYTHLDYTATLDSTQALMPGVEKSVFPQIQLLDEIHQNEPNSTWILPFPPFDEWVDWAQSFHNFTERWARMEMPGLVLSEEQQRARRKPCVLDEEGVGRCLTLSDQQLKDWWCNHIRHVRKVVQDVYPTHKLVEFDFEDKSTTSKVLKHLTLAKGLEANETCLSMLYQVT
jgi:hypothetical protein